MFLPTVRKGESVRSLTQLLVFRCPLRRPYKGPYKDLKDLSAPAMASPRTAPWGGETSKRLIQRNLSCSVEPLHSPLHL